ncbi:hypothetical protein ACS0TY_002052 [Phlomoides rotata]
MSANGTIKSPKSILMFPWLAYGHITPYLELAKKLSSRGFHIYLCSTRATLASINNNIPPQLSNSIELIPLFLQVSDDLPPENHSTNGLSSALMSQLKQSLDQSFPTFSLILKNLKPDLLIYDFLQPWAPLAAKPLNIPSIIFITSSSTMSSFMFHHFKTPDTVFPHESIKFHDYESSLMNKLLEDARDEVERTRCSLGVERSTKIVLIKGFREIEGKYIDYVSSLTGKKFVPVGPLVLEPNFNGSSEILTWLDGREEKSTVLVSFGSEYFPCKEDMVEIAHGLELSNVNFIWVVRFPKGGDSCLKETLPEGFVERVEGRGRVVEGWAPQTKILGHASIGGFVSHCGWNSVLESMKYGVPVIAVPMHLDQPINARLVVEVGVGMEVLRDGNKRLHREAFAAVVKRVVVGHDGGPMRRKAMEMREKLEAKGDEEMFEVVEQLVELCGNTSTHK